MAYATIGDVLRRYPPVATMVGSDTTDVTSTEVESIYIADAESYINASLRSRYVTPLAAEPLITQVTADIAIYRMLEDKAPRIPDMAEKRWIAANSTLAMLRDGTMLLDPSSQVNVASGGDQDAWSNVLEQAGPIFRPAEDITNTRSLMDPDFDLGRRW